VNSITGLPSPDVIVIGGGVAGASAAFFLSLTGATVTLIERDGVANHASGMSAGGLNPLEGEHIPGALSEIAMHSYRLHLQLWEELAERSDVTFAPRIVPWISIALSEGDLPHLESAFQAFDGADGFSAEHLDTAAVLEMEPRISPDVIGGVYLYGNAAVDSRALTLALMTAAEAMGTTFIRAEVNGLSVDGARPISVAVGSDILTAGSVVVAAGPWSARLLQTAGVRLPVRPLKGEILRLDPPGPLFRHDIAYPGGEAHPKPDGLVWVGATVEDAGFDTRTSKWARERLMADAVRAIPALAKSRVAEQTACLRPVTPDGLPVVGPVPGSGSGSGSGGLYIASGAGKKGILLGPAMGRAISDLVVSGRTDLPVGQFAPDRFALLADD
jgi:glycine oxidase